MGPHREVRFPIPLAKVRRWALLLTAVLAVVAVGCGSQSGVDGDYPIMPTDELIQVGQPLYAQNCATCHGNDTTRPPLATAPPHTNDGHTWHHADRLLVDWILDGVPLATVMPTWRDRLTEDEVRAVVAYIKTFWPESIQQQQIRGSEQYEEQVRTFGE